MNALLKFGREIVIGVLGLLLAVMVCRADFMERQYGKAETALQVEVSIEHMRVVKLREQLEDQKQAHKQELQEWKDGACERELGMVQEQNKVETELRSYQEKFGPMPLRIVGPHHVHSWTAEARCRGCDLKHTTVAEQAGRLESLTRMVREINSLTSR